MSQIHGALIRFRLRMILQRPQILSSTCNATESCLRLEHCQIPHLVFVFLSKEQILHRDSVVKHRCSAGLDACWLKGIRARWVILPAYLSCR